MSQPNILLLGPPGAGKGTQSSNIVERFGVEHVTTGDALRANKGMDISDLDVAYDTPGGFMNAGELVPDAVVNEIVKTALESADGYVLDGYPRNLDQAEYLDSITDLDVVASLEVSREELVDRLTGRRVCSECGANYHVEFDQPAEEGVCDECGGELVQRDDDTEETVRERLRVFDENTRPVIEFYDEQGDLVRVDGEGSPDEVWSELEAAIEART
jgi:adenylate kinase